ncbi:MAG: TonB-dependent receptor [Bacteroidaceae bacterium]|nr:TonB-dependent receptor [Bacteroidaceae bacterium]
MHNCLLTLATIVCAYGDSHNVETDSIRHDVLNEVEIVAEPKEVETLHQQPLSSTAIGSEQIANNHISNIKSINALAPGLYIPDYGSKMTNAIYIRGIGSRINSPAVGLYVDDVPYLDKSAFDFNLFDAEHIDVIRGPQGTLYGRNTMGGVIKIQTRSPFLYQGTDVRMGYATGNHRRHIALTHSRKASETFAFTIGGYYDGNNGFFTNSYTGQKIDHGEDGGIKWKGVWRPNIHWDVKFNMSYDRSIEGTYPYFYTGTVNGTEPFKESVGQITTNRDSHYRRQLANASIHTQYNKDAWTFTSVTSTQHLRDCMQMDQDFIAADIYTLTQRQEMGAFNQEFSLKSTKSSNWRWITGINFSAQDLFTESPVTFYSDGIHWLEDIINSAMPATMGANITFKGENIAMPSVFDAPVINAAVFHQSTIKLGTHFGLIAGIRLDYEHNRLDYNSNTTLQYDFAIQKPRPITLTNQETSSSLVGKIQHNYFKCLPKLALRYNVNPNYSFFASSARGMRSGGYNIQMISDLLRADIINRMRNPSAELPNVDQAITYKPETSWNAELGGHLSPVAGLDITFACYYIRTSNQQIAKFAPSGLGRMMANAGISRSLGSECQIRYNTNLSTTSKIQLATAYGYTNAKFIDYDDGTRNYIDNWIPFVPLHTVNGEVAYVHLLKKGRVQSLTFGINGRGLGQLYWTEDNTKTQPFYVLLDSHVGVDFGKITTTLWGRNVTASKYQAFYFESAGRGFEQRGTPAQFGMDIHIRF